MSEVAIEKPRWSKKKRFRNLASIGRSAKLARVQENVSNPELAPDGSLDESLIVPRVEVFPEDEDSEEAEDVPLTKDTAKEVYKEWIASQCKDTTKMFAIIMMDTFRTRFGLTDVAAATEAGMVVGFNEKTVRTWHNDFYGQGGTFSQSQQGRHNHRCVLDDEDCRKKASAWLHENAYKKGPNVMTAATFATWVNTDLFPNSHLSPGFPRSITTRTAAKWLHNLGFSPRSYKKGLYFDGHEREDVIEYRKLYLRKIEILQSTHLPPPYGLGGETEELIGSSTAEKRLVLLYHDESRFHSNEGQTWQWAEENRLTLRPKGQGRGLMISDFIDEHHGFLRLTPEEHELAKLSHPGLPKAARVIFKGKAIGIMIISLLKLSLQ